MELYDSIFVRRSIRKYKKDKLSADQQSKIMDFAEKAVPLYPDIKTRVKIVSSQEINGLLAVKAPQYLLIYTEKKQGDLINAGFVLQQIDLYLSTQGIGSCWLGMATPKIDPPEGFEFVIMLAVGVANEPLYRDDISEFNRKTLSEIALGEDARYEAARLAPSARNGQPWLFVSDEKNIKIYRRKPRGLLNSVFDRLSQVDVGITLCHLMLASEHSGIPFAFAESTDLPAIDDYLPVGIA